MCKLRQRGQGYGGRPPAGSRGIDPSLQPPPCGGRWLRGECQAVVFLSKVPKKGKKAGAGEPLKRKRPQGSNRGRQPWGRFASGGGVGDANEPEASPRRGHQGSRQKHHPCGARPPRLGQAGRRAAPPCARHAAVAGRLPNDLWCADFKGEFKLGNGRYCYPLTVTDHASRFLLANETEAVQDGRIHIENINGPFLFRDGGSPAEYGAGLAYAIEKGWLWKHESGTYVKFTQAGADLFA